MTDGKPLPADAGVKLIGLAQAAIARRLGTAASGSHEDAPWLLAPAATFVTLKLGEVLRGCIGSLAATRALRDDVQANALAAAFEDPRFKPLTPAEFATLDLEVSLLSAPQPLQWKDEADALRQLRPRVDGVIFEYGYHRSTFLPQVWAQVEAPAAFMAQLKYKAGLPPDFWDARIKLSRYTVDHWQASTLAAAPLDSSTQHSDLA